MKDIISTANAPAAIGPYSQGVAAGGFVFTSGQLPIDPKSGVMPKDIAAQTRQSLTNVKGVLEASGCAMRDVVKVTVFLKHMEDFSEMNTVYAEFFPEGCPARSAFQVACLPKDALVEIEAVAART